MYEEAVRPFTADLLNGRSGCVLAFGQTGAGKTYTVFGDDDSTGGPPTLCEPAALPSTAGLVPRVLSEILDAIPARRGISRRIQTRSMRLAKGMDCQPRIQQPSAPSSWM